MKTRFQGLLFKISDSYRYSKTRKTVGVRVSADPVCAVELYKLTAVVHNP